MRGDNLLARAASVIVKNAKNTLATFLPPVCVRGSLKGWRIRLVSCADGEIVRVLPSVTQSREW
jgi:hypothetical protein